MASRYVSLSIDLDALDLYQGLYGLSQPLSEQAEQAVPARAAERFCDLCATLGIPGTLFVVGRDVSLGRGHHELRAAAAGGHEIANHSFSHDYALSRGSVEQIEADLARADDAIEGAAGQRPVGFRAPGYTVSANLMEAVRRRGYAYDSSLLPSPPYYTAKALVMGAMGLVGKRSHSILGNPGQLFRSRSPHRDRTGVLELPVSVVPGLRIPFYGTWIVTAPDAARTATAAMLKSDELVVVELHGVDLCDASDGVPDEILARQRDIRIPAALKRRRIEAAMRQLLAGREASTLAAYAARRSG